MNWIKSFVRPKIRGILGTKKETPDNMWIKCPLTGEMVFYRDLEANQFVIPGSDYHMNWRPKLRLAAMFDEGDYENITFPEVATDPLKFKDQKKYTDRLKAAKSAGDQQDAIVTGYGKLHDLPIVITVQDFKFMGGSLGMAAGQALIVSMQLAVEKKCPYVLFVASGGARMQEGILSLMQMPRTTVAVQQLREANLPYIVVFTDPTTGGVTASYAMLGDIHLAEPNARIGFAGARVIEQTIREKLPAGFQRSEYLQDHGMVDLIVHRRDMRETVARIARMLVKAPEIDMTAKSVDEPETTNDAHGEATDETTNDATESDAKSSVDSGADSGAETEPVQD